MKEGQEEHNLFAALDSEPQLLDEDAEEEGDLVGTYHNQLINEKLFYNNRHRHKRNPGQLSQRESRKKPLEIDGEQSLSMQVDASTNRGKKVNHSRKSRSPLRDLSEHDLDGKYLDFGLDRQSQESSFQQY